jgi:hypothetical protein
LIIFISLNAATVFSGEVASFAFANLWEASGIGYGPQNGARQQIIEATLDYVDMFANKFLADNP